MTETETDPSVVNRRKGEAQIQIGARIRSFDFGPNDDTYIVGIVKEIGPVDHLTTTDWLSNEEVPMCAPGCDHIHIEAEYRVIHGERTRPDTFAEGTMVYPHLGNHIEIISDDPEKLRKWGEGED